MEHTPGPWEAWDDDELNATIWIMQSANGTHIASCWPTVESAIISNAHLIAAAPDLLAACRRAREAISTLSEDALGFEYERWVSWPLRDELLDQLEKAIAKAKGSE